MTDPLESRVIEVVQGPTEESAEELWKTLTKKQRTAIQAVDNVFIERLWRSLKYEDIYLKGYDSRADCHQGLISYFKFYCHERPHQSLRNAHWMVSYAARNSATTGYTGRISIFGVSVSSQFKSQNWVGAIPFCVFKWRIEVDEAVSAS